MSSVRLRIKDEASRWAGTDVAAASVMDDRGKGGKKAAPKSTNRASGARGSRSTSAVKPEKPSLHNSEEVVGAGKNSGEKLRRISLPEMKGFDGVRNK